MVFGTDGVSEVHLVLTDVLFDDRQDTIQMIMIIKLWIKLVFKVLDSPYLSLKDFMNTYPSGVFCITYSSNRSLIFIFLSL